MGLTKHGQGEILREEGDLPAKSASQQERERLMAEVRKEQGEEDEA
jgi:hypothetical protein